jgi:hypothetical protein
VNNQNEEGNRKLKSSKFKKKKKSFYEDLPKKYFCNEGKCKKDFSTEYKLKVNYLFIRSTGENTEAYVLFAATSPHVPLASLTRRHGFPTRRIPILRRGKTSNLPADTSAARSVSKPKSRSYLTTTSWNLNAKRRRIY